MNMEEAERLDCEIREYLNNFSAEHGLETEFGNMIMDKYFELIPDITKRDMIFLGNASASYKLGNVKLDLKNVMLALANFVASLNQPKSVFEYVQLVIISVLCVGTITKKELDYNCAVVVYALHKINAYDIGFTLEQLKNQIIKMLEDYQVKVFKMEKLDETIEDLLKWKVICMEDEKIYLNEKIWGRIKG